MGWIQIVDYTSYDINPFEVGNRLKRFITKGIDIFSDDLIAEGMKGENMNLLSIGTNKFQKPFAHGNNACIGKGKAEYVLWCSIGIQQNLTDSGSEDMRFSCARTSDG
jgi:hypothetical protein